MEYNKRKEIETNRTPKHFIEVSTIFHLIMYEFNFI